VSAQPLRAESMLMNSEYPLWANRLFQSTYDVVKVPQGSPRPDKRHVQDLQRDPTRKRARRRCVELRRCWRLQQTAEEMVVLRVRATNSLTDEIRPTPDCTRSHEANAALSKLEGMYIDSNEFLGELTKFRDAFVDQTHASVRKGKEFHKAAEQA